MIWIIVGYQNQRIKKNLKGVGNELKEHINRRGLSKHAEENALMRYYSTCKSNYRRYLDGNRSYVNCKRNINIPIRKLKIVVIRTNSYGELLDSKPCSHCVNVMKSYGIKKVIYSTKSSDNTQCMITESIATIVSRPSVGYRSIERSINILNNKQKLFHPKDGIG